MTERVLIDMSNLRTGGGLQVGASFADELTRIRGIGDPRWPWLSSATVLASEVLVANAPALAASGMYQVEETSPIRRLIQPRRRSEFDVSFHVFGPDYGWRRARRRICGFADVSSLNPLFHSLDTASKARLLLRSLLSKQRFSRSDHIVVESNTTADTLASKWGIERRKVSVVPNVPNSILIGSQQARKVRDGQVATVQRQSSPFVFGYPTRAYPHKNLGMIGRACDELKLSFGVDAVFRLTLTPAEWDALDPLTKKYSENVGPLTVDQLPDYYSRLDAVGFLSLNECFSVTPLEAMLFGKPLLASDRDFVREVAGEAAWYCEPTDARSVAASMVAVCKDGPENGVRAQVARTLVRDFPTARDRAERYLDIIQRELESV